DAGNTMLSKEFPAGILVITGANSAVGLRSMPARYLFLDEVDAYPPSADEEGDPVALAEAGTRTLSWRAEALLGSTPTHPGPSRTIPAPSASISRRFIRRSVGLRGSTSHACARWRPLTRRSDASRTACSAKPGSRPARPRIGSASTSDASLGKSARCRAADCS